MKKSSLYLFLVVIFYCLNIFIFAADNQPVKTETLQTNSGPLIITLVGHGSLMFQFKNQTIHVDPYSRVADYSTLPKADIILLTHHHQDHLDTVALGSIRTPQTKLYLTEKCSEKVAGGIIMKIGDVQTFNNIKVEAVPAYNIVNKRTDRTPYHPKGEGNGYIFTFGDKRVYVAGDTENIPEMKQLKSIDVAFLPMNLPYTMTPEMVSEAAHAFKPHILYIYHFKPGATESFEKLKSLLTELKGVELRLPDK